EDANDDEEFGERKRATTAGHSRPSITRTAKGRSRTVPVRSGRKPRARLTCADCSNTPPFRPTSVSGDFVKEQVHAQTEVARHSGRSCLWMRRIRRVVA